MKKVLALLLVIFMTLVPVITACGEIDAPSDESESSSVGGNVETGADTQTEPVGQPDDSQTDTGSQTETEKQEESVVHTDDPELISGDDYTKIMSAPSILGLFEGFANDVMAMIGNKNISFSGSEALTFTYDSSEPVMIWDFETGTIVDGESVTALALDLDLTDFDFIFSYSAKVGEETTDVSVYNAQSETLGKVFVISAPGLFSRNLVVDGDSALKFLSMVLDFASAYIGGLADDGDTQMSGLLGASADDGMLTAADDGSSIPFISIDEDGRISVDPELFELLISLYRIYGDEGIISALQRFAANTSSDMLKLLLPRDDSLAKVEYTTVSGETVEAELATVKLNGLFLKMAILTLANQIEDGETAAAYTKIVDTLPDSIGSYFPDVDTIVSLLRSVADEITLGDALTLNRYIVDGVSIADEVILSDALLSILEEVEWEIEELIDDIRYGDDDYDEYDDYEDYDEDYEYDFTDEDDGEMYILGGEDDEDGDWEDWYRVSGSFILEYYNGVGMFRETEYFSDGASVDTKFITFENGDGKYSYTDYSYDFETTSYSLEISENGFTYVTSEEDNGDYPSKNVRKFDVALTVSAPNDVEFSIVKTTEYSYVYDEWDEESDDYIRTEDSGVEVNSKTVRLKGIDVFDNALESEVEENRYDISTLAGLMEIFSDLMDSEYGMYIEIILSNLLGGSTPEI